MRFNFQNSGFSCLHSKAYVYIKVNDKTKVHFKCRVISRISIYCFLLYNFNASFCYSFNLNFFQNIDIEYCLKTKSKARHTILIPNNVQQLQRDNP
jgi:hypothetical protein